MRNAAVHCFPVFISKFYRISDGAIFLGIVIKLSKVPFKFMVKGMKTILFLLMITVVFNLFFDTRNAAYQFLEADHYS